jgi:SPP1 family predicted phage head-tail adaptor
MYFSDQITLRAFTTSLDSYGDTVKSYTDTTVNANKKSVTRAEFYSSATAGIKVDVVFEVHAEDYSNQQYVTYSSAQYEVIRAYQKGEGIVELVCVRRAT